MIKENICIICEKEATAKNSHIIPMNLIKDCIGIRNNEISYNINIDKFNISQEIYIGNALKHNKNKINKTKLSIIESNPYTLDNVLCNVCEKKLGEIEGKVYSEIICKIRDDKFKNNFKNVNYNNFASLIPLSKKVLKVDLDVYFYSIILRFIYQLKFKELKPNISDFIINSISVFLKSKLYGISNSINSLKTGLIVCITNNPKNHPTSLSTNKFEKLIIPMCHFYIILECKNINTPFGNAINLIPDKEFKFIKNSVELDEKLLTIKNFIQ